MGQIEKFWCLSDREFPEFFKNGPSFYSSSTQWPSVTIFHKSLFFWDTLYIIEKVSECLHDAGEGHEDCADTDADDDVFII